MLRELDEDQGTNNAALQGPDTTRGCSRGGKTEMGYTDGRSDRFRWPGSGCLNHPCLPACSQSLGEVPQAQLHRYWGAKSWCRSRQHPELLSRKQQTPRDSQSWEGARRAARDPRLCAHRSARGRCKGTSRHRRL